MTLISPDDTMRYFKLIFILLLSLPLIYGCDSKLEVNAPWKDITVVYGLLNQNDSIHYLKITKAFLGEGNALMFAQIPDSSNYPETLDVRVEGWEIISKYDSSLQQTILFDTTTITNKEAGDSIFYFPHQLVYRSLGIVKLNSDYIYKLFIKNKETGKEITSRTVLVQKFTNIAKPQPAPARASFDTASGTRNTIDWLSVNGGKRYKVVARIHYLETNKVDPSIIHSKFVDWKLIEIKTNETKEGQRLIYSYPTKAFYTVLGNHIHADTLTEKNLPSNYNRVAYSMEYIFTVAADDYNTYMEVSEPSTTIVQEKPPFSNINNGIGLFSARYDNTKDYPIVQTTFSTKTIQYLKVHPSTYDLGF